MTNNEPAIGPTLAYGCGLTPAAPIMTRMSHRPPTDEEVAAALAAIRVLLDPHDAAGPAPVDGWRASARLLAQRITPMRVRVRPAWNNIERLRKGGADGISGVTGL